MFTNRMIAFQPEVGSSLMYKHNEIRPSIYLANTEHKSVRRAYNDFLADWERVTGNKPVSTSHIPAQPVKQLIVVGTVDSSELVQKLAASGKIQLDGLKGKWESFVIESVEGPFEQVDELIIIAGSDPRGAIYGMYEFSEQMGVSPWYWWMDVPVEKQEQIYFKKGRYEQGEPSVKYRGFFINDEGPSLMTWVRDKFTDFTHEFYSKVFELTLRLKANYHWPAMWDSSFYEDDEQNAATADLYGVVMGTSHHEPMARPHEDWKRHRDGAWDYHKNETVLKQFWTEGIERSKQYENIITIGMRGDGDEAMDSGFSFEENIKLMEKIVTDQRDIISACHGKEASEVPQLWALYKEVMDYYEAGLRVPDDVTLLWSDDNFGNLRRVPTQEEQKRSGGAGIYYHLDYVGGPRSYKWVNTVPLPKIWEQMHKAYHYGADRIWVVNVGDIKPMECQMTFFLKMAWDINQFSTANLASYSVEWAKATFGETYAQEIADVINGYAFMNGRIKPEHLNGGPHYSWENYDEACRELDKFGKIVQKAEKLLEALPAAYLDAFYQVGYYPAKASYQVLKMYQLHALNQLYAIEGRAATNRLADEVERLFEEDKVLTERYHRLSDGKWENMMLQTHIGYTYWQQPEENDMPPVTRIDNLANGTLKVAGPLQFHLHNYQTVHPYLEVYQTGTNPISFQVVCLDTWLEANESEGLLKEETRLSFSINWEQFVKGEEKHGKIVLSGSDGSSHEIDVHARKLAIEPEKDGHVESGGYLSIEAGSYVENVPYSHLSWEEIPHYGRTKSTMAFLPQAGDEGIDWKALDAYPYLRYQFYLPRDERLNLILITAPSLPHVVNDQAEIGVSFDGKELHRLPTVTMEEAQPEEREWEESVIRNARITTLADCELAAGWHTLDVHMLSPVVGLQKILLDSGGLKNSFLGPEESIQIGGDGI